MSSFTTPGRMLFEQLIPERFRKDLPPDQPVDSGMVKGILQKIADEDPGSYRALSHGLLKFGAKASSETESSFGLEDLMSPIDKVGMLKSVEGDEDKIFSRKDLTPDQRDHELIKLYSKFSNEMPERIFREAQAKGSNLSKMVASGARGTKGNLNSNIGADWLVLDSNSNPVPVPIKNNYAEGLDPSEYFASAAGTRRGLISTKFAVQDAGFLGKQLSAASHDIVVTEHDCGTDRGIPSTSDDKDNVGAVLARPVAGIPAGAVLSARSLKEMRDKGVQNIMVRSPLTCGSAKGLCSICSGVRERNHLPKIMDNLGVAASSSLAEPLSQGSLSEKHSGGVASSSGKAMSGFARVNNLVQVPSVFPGGATLAKEDGVISRIEAAPQGGHFVHVNQQRHYVSGDLDLKVKRGDTVEAGDVLSGGIPNPAEIVQHKGIGEGRMYFVGAMRQAFKDNNLISNRRNIEVIGRAMINHVRVSSADGLGDHLPDDVVEYNALEHNWQPRPDSKVLPVAKTAGMYLEKPALHYSIGTRVTPRVMKTLGDSGQTDIHVHHESPGFEPEMVRLMEVPAHKPDWAAQLAGSYLKRNLLTNIHDGGASSDLHGTSFLPALAYGKDFGKPPNGVGY